jgi:hypothetical protein
MWFDVLFYVVGYGVVGAMVAGGYLMELRRAMSEPWLEAARAAGLDDVKAVWGWSRARLQGRKGRFTVQLRRGLAYREKTTTLVVVDGLPPSLTLKAETASSRSARGRGMRDLELGDREFDDEIYLQGSPALVQAIMDAETRARVRSMLGNEVAVQGGQLQAIVDDQYALGPGTPVAALLPVLMDFAERLVRPVDLVERLVANARRDPVAGVRQASLLALAREFSDHALTRPTLLAALSDPSDEVRLRAATMLVPEGTPVLHEIAGAENTADGCAARAVTTLGAKLPFERTAAILMHALRTRRLETAAACLAGLGVAHARDAVPILAKVLAMETGPLAEAAARALGQCGGGDAEAALIAGLGHAAGPARLAVAEALGSSGSVAAVEPLQDAEAHRSAEAAFRRAARQAIASIQSRAGTASPGQLTLAEGESGRLSLEDDAAGHVSLTPTNTTLPGPR